MVYRTRPTSEWKEDVIEYEFQSAKRSTLDTYEEEVKYLYQGSQEEEQQMLKTILQIAANVEIRLERIYLRIEDPSLPFAMGVLIPSISVESADANWDKLEIAIENAVAMFKQVTLKNLSIFLETEEERANIDMAFQTSSQIPRQESVSEPEVELEQQIAEHMDQAFAVGKSDNLFILKNFCLDARYTMVIDKQKLVGSMPPDQYSDVQIQVLFGGLFDSERNDSHFLSLKVTEEQLIALSYFGSFTGLYNTFRFGILSKYNERPISFADEDVVEYINNYQEYQNAQGNQGIIGKFLLYQREQTVESLNSQASINFEDWYQTKLNEIQKTFDKGKKDIEMLSRNQYNPEDALNKAKEQTYVLKVMIPKLEISLFTSNRERGKPIFFTAIEGITYEARTESHTNYSKMFISLDNFFIRDYYTPYDELPFVIQIALKQAHHYKYNTPCLEFTLESNPKEVDLNATMVIKAQTYRQMYIYSNLKFCSTILQLTRRITYRIDENYIRLVNNAPDEIRKKINKGSFYQKVMNEYLAETYNSFEKNVSELKQGKYEKQKLYYKIQVHSPKLIFSERLFADKIIDDTDTPTIIVDLGLIEANTLLIKEEQGVNYNEVMEESQLYDIQVMKFGKMRVTVDYDLKFQSINEDQRKDRLLNWVLSKSAFSLSSEFNMGIEIKTCLVPFHPKFPTEFQNQLNDYLQEQDDQPLSVSEFPDNESQLLFVDQQGYSFSIQNDNIEQIVEEDKTTTMEFNFIINKMRIILQEIEKPTFSPSNHNSPSMSLSDICLSELIRQPISKKDLIEFGLSNLKGQIIMNNQDIRAKYFVYKLYVKDLSPEQRKQYRNLVCNPYVFDQENHENSFFKPSMPSGFKSRTPNHQPGHKKQRSFNYLGQDSVNEFKSIITQQTVPIDFQEFERFKPEEEILSLNNQIKVEYHQKEEISDIDIYVRTIRVQFNIPSIRLLLQSYSDYVNQQRLIETDVKLGLSGKFLMKKATKRDLERAYQQSDRSFCRRQDSEAYKSNESYLKSLASFSPIKQSAIQGGKQFLKRKPSQINEQKNREYQKSITLIQTVSLAKSQHKEEEEKNREAVLKRHKNEKMIKNSKLKIQVLLETLEIIFPSNIYSDDGTNLTISLKSNIVFENDSKIEETYIFKKNQQKELFDTITLSANSTQQYNFWNLQIYVEDNGEFVEDELGSSYQEKIYFLYPLDFVMDIHSQMKFIDRSRNSNYMKITYKFAQELNMTIGFKEFNSYLIIFQLYFAFMNEYNEIMDKLNKKDNDQGPQFQEFQEKELGLEQILYNENLLVKKQNKSVNRWKKGIIKAIDTTKRQDLYQMVNDFSFKKISLGFVDNLTDIDQQLLKFTFSKLTMKTEAISFDTLDPFKLERLFEQNNIQDRCSFFELNFKMESTYYNKNIFSSEPFIEKFKFLMRTEQKRPMSEMEALYECMDVININFTYGLASTMQRALKNLSIYEHLNNKHNLIDGKKNILLNQKSSNFIGQNQIGQIQLKFMSEVKKAQAEQFFQDHSLKLQNQNKFDMIHQEIKEQRSILEKQQNFLSQSHINESQENINEYVFINCLETPIQFCFSAHGSQFKKYKENQHSSTRQIHQLGIGEHEVIYSNEIYGNMNEVGNEGKSFKDKGFNHKIHFCIQGFQKVTNIMLDKNGIYGYYLFREGQSRVYRSINDSSDTSCIVRIIRDNFTSFVHFESSLVIFNNSYQNFKLVSETDKGFEEQNSINVHQKKIIFAPFPWFSEKTRLYLQENDEAHKQEIFTNISEALNPRIIKPYNNYASIQQINNKFHSLDIHFLKTKGPAGQFLVTVQPLVRVKNLLFTEISFHPYRKASSEERKVHLKLKTNEYGALYNLNPYDQSNDNQKISLKFKEDENLIYKGVGSFKADLFTKDKHIGSNRCKVFRLDLPEKYKREGAQNTQELAFEILHDNYSIRDTEYDNFMLRPKIYSRSKSITFQVFIPIVAVNRTQLVINLLTGNKRISIQPFSNVCLSPQSTRMQIEVADHQVSNKFSAQTLGLSGVVQLHKVQDKSKNASNSIIDASSNKFAKSLEIGTDLRMCQHPYIRTRIIKFLPRYYLINKLDVGIVFKESGSNHQIALSLNEQVPFNLTDNNVTDLMIRVIDLKRECKQAQNQSFANLHIQEQNQYSDPQLGRKSFLSDKDLKERNEESIINDDAVYFEIHKGYGMYESRDIWSYKFSIQDMDDFQITVPNLNKELPLYQNSKQWSETPEKLYVRVTISPNYPEYVFNNKLDKRISIQHKSDNPREQNELYILDPYQYKAIILNPKLKDEDYLQIKFLDDKKAKGFIYEIDSLEQSYVLSKRKNPIHLFMLTRISGNLRFISLMTKEQKEKEDRQKEQESKQNRLEKQTQNQKSKFLKVKTTQNAEMMYQYNKDQEIQFKYSRQRMEVNIKGIGISLVDYNPQEICYISISNIYLDTFSVKFIMYQFQKFTKNGKLEKTREKVLFQIDNFQIDNMTLKSFPIILGPFKQYQNYESNLIYQLLDNVKSMLIEDYKSNQEQFFFFNSDRSQMKEGKIQNSRIKHLTIAMKEIQLNIHQHSINNILLFYSTVLEMLSDDVVNPFMASDLMANYNELMKIIAGQDQNAERIKQDGMGAKRNQPLQEVMLVEEEKKEALSQQNEEDRQNSFLKQENYGGTTTKSQAIVKNPPMIVRSPTIKTKFKTKEEICNDLKVERGCGCLPDDFITNSGKILIQKLNIKAMRSHLTFRLKKLGDQSGNAGILQSIVNFFSSLTNISDAQMYFSEIDIENAYQTLAMVQNTLITHYQKQGIEQFYQLLGSTDLIGNPASLVNNLGRGVGELYNEPLQGVLGSGNATAAFRGVGKGLKGLVSNTSYAVSNSLSRMSGTLYLGLKNLSGAQESESNLDNPSNPGSGLAKGTLGLFKELGQGVAGIVTKPSKTIREQGCGVGQVCKGTAQGLLGLVSAPVNGNLRFIHSLSTGIKNFAKRETQMGSGRVRFPRYINEREEIVAYDESKSHASTVLKTIKQGIYRNETLLEAYDCPTIQKKTMCKTVCQRKDQFKYRIVFITHNRILYVHNLKQIKFELHLREIAKIHVEAQNNCIIFQTKENKTVFFEIDEDNQEIIKNVYSDLVTKFKSLYSHKRTFSALQ